MTTDITELAQSLKAAAIDAKELAIIARYSKGRAAAEKFYALANPNNVLALVEALEKAQRCIASQREYYDGVIADGGKRIAELDAVLEREREKSRRVMSRIAELESRTVKLPDSNDERFWGYGAEFEVKLYDSCVYHALTTAGIKWEAE